MVDASGSQRRLIEEERRASGKFLEEMVRPDRDQVYVLQFDRNVHLLQEFTGSVTKLRKAVGRIYAAQTKGTLGCRVLSSANEMVESRFGNLTSAGQTPRWR